MQSFDHQYNNKLQLGYDRLNFNLSQKIYVRKKSELKKYISKIFFKEFKHLLYRYETGLLKNFSRYNQLYEIYRLLPQKNILADKQLCIQKDNHPVFALKPVDALLTNRVRIKQFIMQTRQNKEGFTY